MNPLPPALQSLLDAANALNASQPDAASEAVRLTNELRQWQLTHADDITPTLNRLATLADPTNTAQPAASAAQPQAEVEPGGDLFELTGGDLDSLRERLQAGATAANAATSTVRRSVQPRARRVTNRPAVAEETPLAIPDPTPAIQSVITQAVQGPPASVPPQTPSQAAMSDTGFAAPAATSANAAAKPVGAAQPQADANADPAVIILREIRDLIRSRGSSASPPPRPVTHTASAPLGGSGRGVPFWQSAAQSASQAVGRSAIGRAVGARLGRAGQALSRTSFGKAIAGSRLGRVAKVAAAGRGLAGAGLAGAGARLGSLGGPVGMVAGMVGGKAMDAGFQRVQAVVGQTARILNPLELGQGRAAAAGRGLAAMAGHAWDGTVGAMFGGQGRGGNRGQGGGGGGGGTPGGGGGNRGQKGGGGTPGGGTVGAMFGGQGGGGAGGGGGVGGGGGGTPGSGTVGAVFGGGGGNRGQGGGGGGNSMAGVPGQVITSFAKLAKAGHDLAYQQEQHARTLADVSPSMAIAVAELDRNRTFRDRDIGEATAGDSSDLMDKINKLEEMLAPMEIAVSNLASIVSGKVVGALTDMASYAGDVIKFLGDYFPWFKAAVKRLEEGKEGDAPAATLQDMVESAAAWDDRRRAAADAAIERARRLHNR